MLVSLTPKSDHQSSLSRIKTSLFSLLALTVVVGSLPSNVYGWWFTDHNPQTSITPTHRSGLVLSPLAQRVLPEFILEPLSKEEKESPPSVEAPATTKNSGVILSETPPSSSPKDNNREASTSSIATQMLAAVNAERAARNLPSLTLNAQLSQSAQQYAKLMQDKSFFSHTSPSGTTFKDRNESAGYTNWAWMGENIAVGQTSVAEVVEDWMNSEGHRANILEPRARELGVGYVGGKSPYWVQEFGVQF